MTKINEDVLHKTIFRYQGRDIYHCATVDPMDFSFLHVGLTQIWVAGTDRLELIAKTSGGLDRWLEYRCELAKVMLGKRIDAIFDHSAWKAEMFKRAGVFFFPPQI